jgi:hypothetical protein
MMQGDTRRGRATNPAGATGSFLCHHKGHPGPRNDAIRGPGSAISFPTDESMFVWTKAEAIAMGPMGTYQLFATGNGPVGEAHRSQRSAEIAPRDAPTVFQQLVQDAIDGSGGNGKRCAAGARYNHADQRSLRIHCDAAFQMGIEKTVQQPPFARLICENSEPSRTNSER